MNVAKLMADCDFIMRASSHVYNGNKSDCKALSAKFGRTVVSSSNFTAESRFLNTLINIIEATFDDDSQIVVIQSDELIVFVYLKNTYCSVPDEYRVLDDSMDWQNDIDHLATLVEHGFI